MSDQRERDPLTTVRTRVAMPAALRQRLRNIPAEVVLCRDVDRLVAATRHRARGRRAEPAAVRHLETCARCQATYDALGAAFAAAYADQRRPVPPSLVARLGALARRAPVPRLFVEVDFRLAAAASLLIGLLMQPLAAEVAQATRWAGGHARGVSSQWLDTGAAGTGALWQIGQRGLRRGLDLSSATAQAVETGWRRMRTSTDEFLRDTVTTIERLIEGEGDSHG